MNALAGSLPAERGRAMLLPSLAILVAGAALWPSLHSLLEYWRDIHEYQHGYVIALLALVWTARVLWHLPAQPLRASHPATAALALVLLFWLVAVRGGIDILHQLLWPLALWLAAWASGGRALAWRLFAPLAFLYFAVPVWDYTVPVLQRLSIFFSEHLLALLGVAATVTEYQVTIPEGTFAIVEGCSGKRYFMVTLALAWLAIAVNRVPLRRTALLLAASALLAMAMNWLRIVIVIHAGHVSDMQHHFVAVEHKTLGNVLFVVLLVAVLLLARQLGAAQPQPVAPAAGSALPWSTIAQFPAAVRGVLAVLILVLVAGLMARLEPASTAIQASLTLPLVTDRWQGPLPASSGWHPTYVAADAERRASYEGPAGGVEIYANLYLSQDKKRELIQYGNNLASPWGWERPWSERSATITTSGPSLTSYRMRSPEGEAWLLAHVYLVGNASYQQPLAAKLAYGWQSIWRPAPTGVIALAARCGPANCDDARARIADIWDNQHSRLRAMMSAGASRPQ